MFGKREFEPLDILESFISTTKASSPKFVEKQNQIQKAYPILDCSDEQVSQYIIDNDLPAHPLQKKGYVTSGDVHSTKPLQDVANAEETRFGGQKYECGLHRPTNDSSLVL